MDRLTNVLAGLVVFGIVGALVIGAGLGARSVFEAPAIVEAEAARRLAEVDQARAVAAGEWERVEQLKLQTQQQEADARAWVGSAPARTQSTIIIAYAGGVAVGFAMIGFVLVGVVWAWRRAHIIYPAADGRWPVMIERNRSGLAIIDLSRAVSPVTMISSLGELSAPMLAPDELQLQITSQAQQAAVMTGIAGHREGEAMAARVSSAVASLPQFTGNGGAARGESDKGLRLVYVKRPGNSGSEAARELQDLREFLQRGSEIGFARSNWIGHAFQSGHRGTRARYDDLISKCKQAAVIGESGQSWVLAVSLSDALDSFGVGDKDQAESEA